MSLKDHFYSEYWTIGWRTTRKGVNILNDTGEQYSFYVYTPPKGKWATDPFIFEYKGISYLFFVLYHVEKKKGSIVVSKIINNNITEPKIIMKNHSHLSYPLVFEKDGRVFLIPGTNENRIDVYEAKTFPNDWVYYDTLFKNIRGANTTVFSHGATDWIVTTHVNPATNYEPGLMVFYVDQKNYRWREHPMNPVMVGNGVRAAGDVFRMDDHLILPYQETTNGHYDRTLIFNKIAALNKSAFLVSAIKRVEAQEIITDQGNAIGIHTYSQSAKYEAIGVKLRSFAVSNLWKGSRNE